jgi:DNA polymerase-3 subunit gamma/tau
LQNAKCKLQIFYCGSINLQFAFCILHFAIASSARGIMSDPSSQPTPPDPAPPGRYIVIARRYRPQSFEELVGQEHVARALQQAIGSDRVGHAYLFTGARGVGKTSAARILAKALNCVHGPTPTPCNECDVCLRVASGDDVDVLEIDGASNRGIDEIRQLRQNVAVRPSRVRFKIYIIDEVHMLTKEAFNALLKTLEEPPEHVKFIFATTEPQKIPITILSRCQRFDFAGISATSIQERLSQIAAAEGVEIDRGALQILASRAAGSMRDSQSLLEQLLAVGHKIITTDDVNQLLGIASAERLNGLVQHLVNRDAAAALSELDATVASGVEVGLLLDQLVGYVRDAMAAAVGCSPEQLLYALPSQADEVAQAAQKLGLSTILAIGQILDHTAARMRVSMHGRTLVEMAIVRICQLGELDDLATLIAELRGADNEAKLLTPAPKSPLSAKKNAEPEVPSQNAAGLAASYEQQQSGVKPPVAEPLRETLAGFARRSDPDHSAQSPRDTLQDVELNATADDDSVVARFQRRVAEGVSTRSSSMQPRPSRREQTAKVAEHPFVRHAMELFDAPLDKLRYTPPEERSTGVAEQ